MIGNNKATLKTIIKHHFKATITLFLIWLSLTNFSIHGETLVLGVVSTGLTVYFLKKAGILSEMKIINIKFVKYVQILMYDIFKSTIYVSKIIFSDKKLGTNSDFENIKFSRKTTNKDKVMLANMITMTPGTIAISVENNSFLVHSINKTNKPDIEKVKDVL